MADSHFYLGHSLRPARQFFEKTWDWVKRSARGMRRGTFNDHLRRQAVEDTRPIGNRSTRITDAYEEMVLNRLANQPALTTPIVEWIGNERLLKTMMPTYYS